MNREQWSRRQAELFIATQAVLLANNEGKALPPPDLQKKITSILKSNPDLSGAVSIMIKIVPNMYDFVSQSRNYTKQYFTHVHRSLMNYYYKFHSLS